MQRFLYIFLKYLYTQMTVKLIFWIILSKGRNFSYYDFASSESVYTHSQNHPQNLYTHSVCTFEVIRILGNPQTPDGIIRDRKRKWYNKHTIVTVICSVQINELYLNFNFEKKGIK